MVARRRKKGIVVKSSRAHEATAMTYFGTWTCIATGFVDKPRILRMFDSGWSPVDTTEFESGPGSANSRNYMSDP